MEFFHSKFVKKKRKILSPGISFPPLRVKLLLFLHHIKKLTWLDETTGKYGEYECKIDSKDGKICICRKSDNEGTEQESRYLVYEKYNRLVSSVNVSQYDLDRRLYEELPYNSPLFECLKFKIDSKDRKKSLMEVIQKWTGDALRDLEQVVRDERKRRGEREESTDYDNEDWKFPRGRILDLKRLHRHVQEEFACAELVRYERVPRSIRITQNNIDQRSYLKSLYEESNQYGCQLCHEPYFDFVAVEIEKIRRENWSKCISAYALIAR